MVLNLLDKKYDKIILNKSNKNDVRKIIGPPSSISKFDDTWFYIERKKQINQFLNLAKKIYSNNIIIFKFNNNGFSFK